jgi:hypothetical protein
MADPTYEAPVIADIGTLHELTLTVKSTGGADGIIFDPDGPGPIPGVPIGEVSV